MPIEDSVFQLDFTCFFHSLLELILLKIYLPNHPAQIWCDSSKFQIKMKEWKELRQGGQMTNLDLQKHMLFHICNMALTFRQVNCPLLETADWPWPSNIHMWKFKGVCHAQIISNNTNSLHNHGNSWKFPSTLTTVAGGRGILFPCFGVLVRSKCDKINEYFFRGLIKSMEFTIGLHQQGIR